MIIIKTTCDKCGKEINGIFYKVTNSFTKDAAFVNILQTPKYYSYDICLECMKVVIDENVDGAIFSTPRTFL